MLLTFSTFIGHLHPVLVHLPIGILVMAIIFQWLSHKQRFSFLRPAVRIALFLGMITAIFSCISGYLLSDAGEYDEPLVDWHQWMGISVALVSVIAYFLQRNISNGRFSMLFAFLFGLVVVTGHLGGSLTHGPDFLSPGGGEEEQEQAFKPNIENIQDALVYNDLVQPILKSKCYSCHGKNKQKGGLRMDIPELLLKGGKDGKVLVPGKAGESEMIHRLTLPRDNKDHMPPKQKSQLHQEEISVLNWWIEQGAGFNARVKELQQPQSVRSALLSFQAGNEMKKIVPDIPLDPVEKANDNAMAALKKIGVVVIPVAQNSNYLMASFVSATGINDHSISLLEPLKRQLVWLRLSNKSIGDSSLSVVARCDNITKLYLDFTNITDKGLSHLHSLKNLQYLNLVATKVTASGISSLKDLKNLQAIYLFKANIKTEDWKNLKKIFPNTVIDSGGYYVPLLPTDTTIVKVAKAKV